LAFFQLFFIANLALSVARGRVTTRNPWQSTTLEWSDTQAPVHAYRDPYEYSVPGAPADFTPQGEVA
jgi:cytochrome c oxidase subunit 1